MGREGSLGWVFFFFFFFWRVRAGWGPSVIPVWHSQLARIFVNVSRGRRAQVGRSRDPRLPSPACSVELSKPGGEGEKRVDAGTGQRYTRWRSQPELSLKARCGRTHFRTINSQAQMDLRQPQPFTDLWGQTTLCGGKRHFYSSAIWLMGLCCVISAAKQQLLFLMFG